MTLWLYPHTYNSFKRVNDKKIYKNRSKHWRQLGRGARDWSLRAHTHVAVAISPRFVPARPQITLEYLICGDEHAMKLDWVRFAYNILNCEVSIKTNPASAKTIYYASTRTATIDFPIYLPLCLYSVPYRFIFANALFRQREDGAVLILERRYWGYRT